MQNPEELFYVILMSCVLPSGEIVETSENFNDFESPVIRNLTKATRRMEILSTHAGVHEVQLLQYITWKPGPECRLPKTGINPCKST